MLLRFLLDKIVYEYNDMAILLVYAKQIHEKVQHFPLINTNLEIFEVDFINNVILWVTFKIFPPVLAMNFLALLYLSASFYFSYLLFSSLFKDKFLNIMLSVLNSFSIYTMYRFISLTPNIYQMFFYPLTLFLLYKRTRPLYMGVLLLFFFSFSSYTAYFALLICVFWYTLDPMFEGLTLKNLVKKIFSDNLKLLLPIFLLGVPLFWNVLYKSLPLFSHSSVEKAGFVDNATQKTYRPIENFYNLSTRPWYFFIPPKNSTYFERLSKQIYTKIESTNYYLADDYTEEEAAGSFLGWHFILGMFVVSVLVLFPSFAEKNKLYELFQNRKFIIKLLLIGFGLVLFSFPPSFSISGITFYTPTYLIYKILPVFRTLVRVAAPIFLVTLIVNGYLIEDMLRKISNKYLRVLLIIVICIVSYVSFSIKLPVIDTRNPPEDVKMLSALESANYRYAVYPEADYKHIFWSVFLDKQLLNPVDFIDKEGSFDSNEFTRALPTPVGLDNLNKVKGDYLVVYVSEVDDSMLSDLQKLNVDIKSTQDILQYFTSVYGDPIISNKSAQVFKVSK